ncbi:MAG: glycosyltransferase family 39 protein, partial [Clostridia bacterium]|nr:glycosyltransferase family 39 protein [Clostridia bacterium]
MDATPVKQSKIGAPIRRRSRQLLMCAMIAALCALFAGYLANKGFSPAEGWYSYYAYLINEQGAVPYVDFELLFPPLYTYFIALFTRIFGYNMLALRVLGVVMYAATGVLACLIFEKLTRSTFLGFLGGLLTVAVLQSEAVQIFYDYIRLMDLCVYASIYCFLRYFDQPAAQQDTWWNKNVIAGAVFAVLASMCKQSSGLFYLVFCLCLFLLLSLCLPEKRAYARQLAVMVAAAVVLYGIMLLFLGIKGALGAYFYYNFGAAVG